MRECEIDFSLATLITVNGSFHFHSPQIKGFQLYTLNKKKCMIGLKHCGNQKLKIGLSLHKKDVLDNHNSSESLNSLEDGKGVDSRIEGFPPSLG